MLRRCEKLKNRRRSLVRFQRSYQSHPLDSMLPIWAGELQKQRPFNSRQFLNRPPPPFPHLQQPLALFWAGMNLPLDSCPED